MLPGAFHVAFLAQADLLQEADRRDRTTPFAAGERRRAADSLRNEPKLTAAVEAAPPVVREFAATGPNPDPGPAKPLRGRWGGRERLALVTYIAPAAMNPTIMDPDLALTWLREREPDMRTHRFRSWRIPVAFVMFAMSCADPAGGARDADPEVAADAAPAESSDVIWGLPFRGTGTDWVVDVARFSNGDLLVAGNFDGTIDLGTTLVARDGSVDIFLARLSPDGAPIWSRSYGDRADDFVERVSVDMSDRILVAGRFVLTIDFGSPAGVLVSPTGYDGYLAMLSPEGEGIWSRQIGSSGFDNCINVAVSESGDVFVVGAVGDTVDFGGGPAEPTPSGQVDAFLASYAPDGRYRFAHRFVSATDGGSSAVAVDTTSDRVAIGGSVIGAVDFGGGPFGPTLGPSGDGFVAVYTLDGTHEDSFGTGVGLVSDVAYGPDRDLWVTGWFADLATDNGYDLLLVHYADDRTPLVFKALGGTYLEQGFDLAIHPTGDVVIAGRFTSLEFPLGATVLEGHGGYDGFVARFSGAGDSVWARAFGSIGDDWASTILLTDDATCLVGGLFGGELMIVDETWSAEGVADGMLVKVKW